MHDQMKKDKLEVKIFENRLLMGNAAASEVAEKIKELLAKQESVNIIFAAAPSQNEFLAALAKEKEIDWSRVNAFHMDEYIGLPADAPQNFGTFLKERFFSKVPLRSVHYLNGNATDIQGECNRYAALLMNYPTDIVCMGIGENCHIAFNDPHVARFEDPSLVKKVDLDNACRQQQVNDGCFHAFEEVPAFALTLTIPALMQATAVYCMVPGPNKAQAVHYTLTEQINEKYPSTILRKHTQATLFIEKDSAGLLKSVNLLQHSFS